MSEFTSAASTVMLSSELVHPGSVNTVFTVDWYATRLDGPILKAGPAGACKHLLAIARDGKRGRVSGLFGVFHHGTVDLIGLPTGDAKTGKPVSLGSYYVSPLEPLTLDVEVTLAPTIGTLALVLRDSDGRDLGELDRVPVPPAETEKR